MWTRILSACSLHVKLHVSVSSTIGNAVVPVSPRFAELPLVLSEGRFRRTPCTVTWPCRCWPPSCSASQAVPSGLARVGTGDSRRVTRDDSRLSAEPGRTLPPTAFSARSKFPTSMASAKYAISAPLRSFGRSSPSKRRAPRASSRLLSRSPGLSTPSTALTTERGLSPAREAWG